MAERIQRCDLLALEPTVANKDSLVVVNIVFLAGRLPVIVITRVEVLAFGYIVGVHSVGELTLDGDWQFA